MAGVRMPRGDGRRGPVADLPTAARPRERPFAYGGYANCFYIRPSAGSCSETTAAVTSTSTTRAATDGEHRDIAGSHRGTTRGLYGRVRRKAGGSLPYYRV